MSMIYALDLDYDLVNHLAVENSVEYFRKEQLSPNLVEDPQMRGVFEWQMDHYREHGKAATASVLEAEFDFVSIEEPLTVAADLVDRLRERFGRNEGQDTVKKLGRTVISDPTALGKEMIKEGRRLTALLDSKGNGYGQNDFDRAMHEYDRLVLLGRGPSLGFTELDDYFYGQLGLTFLVGAPKSAKSWVTIKAVYENILAGKNPWLYSLELPEFETYMRLQCMAAKVPFWKYTKRMLTTLDKKALREAAELLDDWGSKRIEKPKFGNRDPQYLIEKARDGGADCIFVDQLQYVENAKGKSLGGLNETGEYWQAINEFRDYSDQGPIFIVHQFNRSILGAKEMPEVQQAKGSSGIEECATLALGLWSTKEMRSSGQLEIGTLISRNYGLQAWEAEANFRSSCHIQITGEKIDD